MHVLRNAIRKVMRGVCVCVCVCGGGGGAGENTESYAREADQRRSEEKKFLQSELHCRADKMCPPNGHLGSHFILEFSRSWWNPH